MTVYAPSDVTSIVIPADRGGCGQPHEAGELAAGTRFSVDCPACEPHIIAAKTGWAHTPHGVHLTPDEIALVEAEEARAKREQNRTWGDPQVLGRAFADALVDSRALPSAPPAEPLTVDRLREHISALPADERALLASMLTDGDEELGDDNGGDDSDIASTVESAVRRPGRPRKIQ